MIISPYLEPSERIKRLLQRQSTRKTISVTVIYREGELRFRGGRVVEYHALPYNRLFAESSRQVLFE